MDIIEAIKNRKSTRAFLDKPVSRQTIETILETARWAPSGVNTQPWHVAVVSGKHKRQLGDAIIEARVSGQTENPDYRYYPEQWQEPYTSRRKSCGMALYGALGISRRDIDKRKQAWYNNYRFFGAPVGLLFFVDKQLGQGSWIDMGMFIQNVMLAAEAHGLATCAQASLAEYPDIVRSMLDLPESYAVVCGMSVGYEDPEAAVNHYRTEREPLESFTRWYD